MPTAALPYMLQSTVVENANYHSHSLFLCEVVRGLQIHTSFPRSARGSESTLLTAVSKYTVEAYTGAFNHIVSMCFDMSEPSP